SHGIIENQDDRERSLARWEGIELVGDGEAAELNLMVSHFPVQIRDGGEQTGNVHVAGDGFRLKGADECFVRINLKRFPNNLLESCEDLRLDQKRPTGDRLMAFPPVVWHPHAHGARSVSLA